MNLQFFNSFFIDTNECDMMLEQSNIWIDNISNPETQAQVLNSRNAQVHMALWWESTCDEIDLCLNKKVTQQVEYMNF